jgi:hypothetical protein
MKRGYREGGGLGGGGAEIKRWLVYCNGTNQPSQWTIDSKSNVEAEKEEPDN